MAGRAIAAVRAAYGDIPGATLVYEMNRRMIAAMVEDVQGEAAPGSLAAAPRSIGDVRAMKAPLVDFSTAMAADIASLRALPDGEGVPPSRHRGENG